MDKNFSSQISRAEELLNNLEQSLNEDLSEQDISDRTLNLTQEILLKMRHLLDQAMYKFFEKHYLPELSETEAETVRVYFPIVSKKDDINSVLGRSKMADLEGNYPGFYRFLESVQPYHKNYKWIRDLSRFANEKHIKLTPQTKRETKRVTVSRGKGSVSWEPGVTFGRGVSVMGVPIDPATQMPVPNKDVKTKVEKWVSFLFENSDVNVLWLCKKSVEDGRKVVKKILEFV
jgi:hypothetical protein